MKWEAIVIRLIEKLTPSDITLIVVLGLSWLLIFWLMKMRSDDKKTEIENTRLLTRAITLIESIAYGSRNRGRDD